MKIAFPTNNQRTITKHISLAKGFLIIDTQTSEKFYIENPVMKKIQQKHIKLNGECGKHGLGTGRIIPPLLKEAGVELFVAKEFGEGMLGNLDYEGIKTLVTDEKDIDIVLSQLKESLMNTKNANNNTLKKDIRLKEMQNFGFGFGRGGRFARGAGFGRGGRCHRRGFGFGFRKGWEE